MARSPVSFTVAGASGKKVSCLFGFGVWAHCETNSLQSLRKKTTGSQRTAPKYRGANGQGTTVDAARENLAEAIALFLEDRREDELRGVLLKEY